MPQGQGGAPALPAAETVKVSGIKFQLTPLSTTSPAAAPGGAPPTAALAPPHPESDDRAAAGAAVNGSKTWDPPL